MELDPSGMGRGGPSFYSPSRPDESNRRAVRQREEILRDRENYFPHGWSPSARTDKQFQFLQQIRGCMETSMFGNHLKNTH